MMRAVVSRLGSTSSNGSCFSTCGLGILTRSNSRNLTGLSSKNTKLSIDQRTNCGQSVIPLLLSSHVSSRLSVIPSPPGPVFTNIIRDFNTSASRGRNWFTPRDDTTFWGRTLKKLGFTEIPKSALRGYGYLIYMQMADDVDYLKFFQRCNLPDTYASWFIVIELHVWLLSARLMQDGSEGRIVRNSLVKGMWEDHELKTKKLEGALPSARRKELQGLNEQFYAALISYDEGLLGDDYILAGALWKRLLHLDTAPPALLPEHFNSQENHDEVAQKVKAVEMLVIYVRYHFIMLNQLSREQLLRKRAFKFLPFDDGLFELMAKMEKSQISGTSSANKSEIRDKMSL